MHGPVDNNAHASPPQIVPSEAAVRLATTATITIASTIGNRPPMVIQVIQN